MDCLYWIYEQFLAGADLGKDLNVNLMCFLAKGELAGDHERVVRTPGNTWPLCLSDTVAKILAAARLH